MSTRTKRTTVTTTTSHGASTSQSQTPTSGRSPGGRFRPPSPTMISRVQEKEELAGLNDRLATYIDKVRSLELENAKLSRQVQTQEETIHKEVTSIKGLYEAELAEARKLLDDTAKEKARLQVDVGNLRAELDELKDKHNKLDKDHTVFKKRVLVAESQVTDLQARLSDAVAQRKHWEDEYNKLKKDYDALLKQLAAAKKQLEDETVRRVDLENRLQSLREDLAFKSTLHEQEMSETINRTRVEIEEVDGKLTNEYESRLTDALREMRDQNDRMIRITREETEEVFEQKMTELRQMAERSDDLAAKAQEEILTYRRRSSELASELSKLRSQTAAQEAQIKDLESQLQREQDAHKESIQIRDSEIRRLRKSIEEQMVEYRDLLDVKIALDMELAAYHNLLEAEENRLNISSTETPKKSRGTPARATPVSSRKRKRVEASALVGSSSTVKESQSSQGYAASTSAKGAVEVNDVDTEGKYIKLYNSGEKDVPLGGWQLRHSSNDQETTYKFHRSTKLAAGQYVTVWSAESEQTHSPPTDLVMKGQKWFTGDKMDSVLLNNSGEEMASRELKRSMSRKSYQVSTGSSEEADSGVERYRGRYYDQQGEGEEGHRSWLWWR